LQSLIKEKSMLTKEFNFYVEHKAELEKEYSGKTLVIKNEKVVGVFDNELDAYMDSIDKYEEGTFLIQKCEPGDKGLTQTFHTRVVFA